MKQPTQKIIFVRDTQPLVHCDVRLSGASEVTWKTDDEGRLDMALEPGLHTVEVLSDEGWMSQEIQINDSRSSLLVVQLNVRDTEMGNPSGAHNTLPFAAQFAALEERYDVESIIGRGGMGVVVKAYDKTLERHVAMKMLSESLRDNVEAQRIFLIEARQVAKLRHPNLVGVHDVTSIDGVALMIFEFVDGKEVEQVLKEQGPLPEGQVRKIAHQLGLALEYLHNQGVIHRDIKPSNMMIKDDGTLKIIDFGLARSLEQINVRGTQVRGTPAYMAPEQIEGKHLGYATDLYQAGVSLFELLTGRLPFEEEGITYAHLFKDAPPIEEFLPGVAPDIAELINACLRKDPMTRPASAASMAALGTPSAPSQTRDDLPAVVTPWEQTAVIAVPPEKPNTSGSFPATKSNAKLGVMLAMIAALILVSVGVIFVMLNKPTPGMPAAEQPEAALAAKAASTPPAAAAPEETDPTPEAAPPVLKEEAQQTATEAIDTAKRLSASSAPEPQTDEEAPTPSSTRPVVKASSKSTSSKRRSAKKPSTDAVVKAVGAKKSKSAASSKAAQDEQGKPLPPGLDPPAAPAAPVPARPEPRPLPDPLLVTTPKGTLPVLRKSGISTTAQKKTKTVKKTTKAPARVRVVPKIKKQKAPPRSF